ncbi:hypothetical protein [Terrarubrum flagellatum]|uniref:hypothetical protein n=1 Tax=Terrirubrum flagellatum TaxID=2895980 RepID=UPI0031451F6A
MNVNRKSRAFVAAALAASLTAGSFASGAQAMPLTQAGVEQSTPSLLNDVRYRKRYYARRGGNRAAAAIALGVLGLAAGAAIASSRRDRYDDDGYYAPAPAYGYYGGGYYRDPGYYAPQRQYYQPQYQPRPQPYAYNGPRNWGGRQWGGRGYGPGFRPDGGVSNERMSDPGGGK